MRGKFLLSIVLSFIMVSSLAVALVGSCINQPNYPTLVCGATPDSISGFGAVEICGNCFPCGLADGVCPEDFYATTTGVQGNCRLCPDPDCATTISGYVFEQGIPVPNTEVITLYNTEDTISARVSLGKTNGSGYYSYTLAAGLHTVFTQYGSYQGPSEQVLLQRGAHTQVNFTINRGTCNPDCTIGSTGVCSASCHGKEGCTFPSNDALGFSSVFVATRCDGLEAGKSQANLGIVNDRTYRFACCQGPFVNTTIVKPSITSSVENKYSNSATWNVPVTYYNEPVTLKITILK